MSDERRMIDAHQHFWRLARGDYAFPSPGDLVLYRDYMPGDLAPIIAASGVESTVVVQATDTLEESAFLLQLAEETPYVAGVVGWWDPRVPDSLDRLLSLPNRAALAGVRPMLQRSPDAEWLLEAGALADLERVATAGLVLDALVDARHLATMVALSRRLPSLKIVIDHMGKPWREPSLFDRWLTHMRELSGSANCWVKISGFPLSTKHNAEHSNPDKVVGHLRNWFGVDRLVWGSDWPVVEREGGYGAALGRMRTYFDNGESRKVFRSNAVTLYGLHADP